MKRNLRIEEKYVKEFLERMEYKNSWEHLKIINKMKWSQKCCSAVINTDTN